MANLKNTSVTNANSIKLPVGTDGDRPGNSQGRLRFNTSRQISEIYSGSDWIDTQTLPDRRQARVAQVPLISTGIVDNSGSITRRDVFSTTPTFNTGPYTFSSSGVTVTEGGYYQVYTNCFFNRNSGARESSGISFYINGSRQRGISNSSYMRGSSGDDNGGNTLSSILYLESGDEVGIGFGRQSGSGSHSLQGNSSAFFIAKLEQPVFSYFEGDRNNNVNSSTSFTNREFLQNPGQQESITGDKITRGLFDYTSSTITVEEDGVYELHAHCYFILVGSEGDNDGGYRWSVGIRFTVNGNSLPYISDSSYNRNRDNHEESSTNLKVLQNLSAGDIIRIQFRQEAQGNTGTYIRLREDESIFSVRKL